MLLHLFETINCFPSFFLCEYIEVEHSVLKERFPKPCIIKFSNDNFKVKYVLKNVDCIEKETTERKYGSYILLTNSTKKLKFIILCDVCFIKIVNTFNLVFKIYLFII